MKAINKFFYALLALATVGMVSCQEAETYEPGAPEVEGCYDVYFPDAATLETQGPTGEVELDPADATEFTYTAYRNNTEGSITVPVVVKTNTDDKFTVSEIVFQEGEDTAQFKVSLNESEIGVAYTLSLAIDDPQYVKQYESANANSLSVTITRVKWNDVGECAYTEDVLTSWWGFGFEPTHPTYNVKVQVRADSIDEEAFQAALDGTGSDAGLSGIYRLVNPYRVGPWADPADTTLESDPTYLVINANPYNRAYIDLQPLGISINGGEASIYSKVGLRLDNGATPTEDMYGSFNGGTLTFPVQALLGCPGGSYVGSNTYYANTEGAFALVVAPALGKYSLTLPEGYEDGDFTFEEVELAEEAMFYSESQVSAWEPILEKGKPAVNTDDADRTFVAQYGYLYRLPELYAVDYPIYFSALLDGTVTLHPSFEEQYTGLVQNGYDVMMAIDAAASKFDPETYELTLVAEFYSYQGEYIIPYGTYKEVISVNAPDFEYIPLYDLKSDFTYDALFTDKFKSEFQSDEWDATLEVGSGPGKGYFADKTPFRIPSAYANGYDIYFVASDEDGTVSVPAGYELQATGTSIYGTPAYIKIQKGQLSKTGVTMTVAVCDAEGNALMPYVCNESLVTYNWLDVATGTYTSAILTAPTSNRKLQQAEGTNIYRIVDWLTTGTNMMFTWDSTTNKCEVVGMNDTGIDSAQFGGVGNLFTCDVRQFYLWVGKDYSWEILEKNGYMQPTYDPESLTFTFEVSYTCPGLGIGMTLGEFVETFTLDAAPAVQEWADYAVGTFTHTTDFFNLPSLPFEETGVVLQRLGESNKFRFPVGGGAFTLEFLFDPTTGMVEVPLGGTGVTVTVEEGVIEACYGDWWALASAWGMTDDSGAPATKDYVYGVFPNSYDAATKTISFYLGYFDAKYGYVFTSENKGNPTLHTFQITGEPAAPSAAPMASSAKVVDKKVEFKGGAKYIGSVRLFETPQSYKSSKATFKKATSEKRSRLEQLQ